MISFSAFADELEKIAGVITVPDSGMTVEKPKTAGVLPDWLDKPRRGESLDPLSEDFAKNQAFGQTVGLQMLPMGMAGSVLGAIITEKLRKPSLLVRRGPPLLGALGGATIGVGLGALSYPGELREQLEIVNRRRARAGLQPIGQESAIRKAPVGLLGGSAAVKKEASLGDFSEYYRRAQDEFDPELIMDRASELRSMRVLNPVLRTAPVKTELDELRRAYHQFTGEK